MDPMCDAPHEYSTLTLLLAVCVSSAVRHLHMSATAVGVTLGMYGLAATRVMQRLAFGIVIDSGQ